MSRSTLQARPFRVRPGALGLAGLVALVAACTAPLAGDSGPTDPDAAREPLAEDPRPPRPAPELTVGPDSVAPPDDEPAPVLGRIAGEPLTSRHLLERLLHRESRLVFDTVDRLISARLALAEAGRLGIRLEAARVDEALAAARGALERAVGRTGVELDRWLVEELGLEPGAYLARLRDEVVEELMAERAIRAWSLAAERRELSVILVETEATARTLMDRAAAGEAFPALAREASLDASAPEGGRIPPVVRNELSPLARLAFRTRPGAVAGPVEELGGWLLLRVDAAPDPLVGPWEQVREAVEADLAARPVQDPEYWQWRAAMERRYRVDLAPLLELTGGARD